MFFPGFLLGGSQTKLYRVTRPRRFEDKSWRLARSPRIQSKPSNCVQLRPPHLSDRSPNTCIASPTTLRLHHPSRRHYPEHCQYYHRICVQTHRLDGVHRRLGPGKFAVLPNSDMVKIPACERTACMLTHFELENGTS